MDDNPPTIRTESHQEIIRVTLRRGTQAIRRTSETVDDPKEDVPDATQITVTLILEPTEKVE